MPSAAERADRLATVLLRWQPAYRLVSTRFPPIDLFERVADPADWDALLALESMTNPRLRDAAGELQRVPPRDRVSGPGASVIMAPFTHLHPDGSRFADARQGAFYAAESLDTAIAETRHHRERFLRQTHEPPTILELRSYLVDVVGLFHELRGRRDDPALAPLYDPDDYGASQALARELRRRDADGLCYDSVRRPQGQCVAAFRPRLMSNLRQGAHLRYTWNGVRIDAVYEIRRLDAR